MTLNIVGQEANVTNLIPPGASIHTWEPRPSDAKTIATTDLIIKNGLQLEEFLTDLTNGANNPKLQIIDTSKGTNKYSPEAVQGFGEMVEENNHSGIDPHIWLSINNAKLQVQNIAAAVIAADPDHEAIYRQNTQDYLAKLDRTFQQIQTELSTVKPQPFIVFHDAYQYFLRDYQLSTYQVASIQPFPGKEPNPAYLQNLTELIKTHKIKVIFTEPQFTSQITELLKTEFSIMTLTIDPIGTQLTRNGFTDNLLNIKDQLITAFQSE